MALDNVTSHFSTVLEPITSASFLSSLSIINDLYFGVDAGVPTIRSPSQTAKM